MRWRDHEAKVVGVLIILVYAIFWFFSGLSLVHAEDRTSGWDDPYTYTSCYNGQPEVSTVYAFPQMVFDGTEYVEYVCERLKQNEFLISCPTSSFHIKTVNTMVLRVDLGEAVLSKCIWQLWYYTGWQWIEVEDVSSAFWLSEGDSSVTVQNRRVMTDGSTFDVTWTFENIAKATIDFTAGQSGNYSIMWHVEVPKANRYVEAENRLIFSNSSEFLAYLDYYDARMCLSNVEVSPLGQTGRKAIVTFANRHFEVGDNITIDPTVSTFDSEASRDGYIVKKGAVYTIKNATTWFYSGNRRDGTEIYRGYLSFNTSSVSGNITNVSLKVYLNRINAGTTVYDIKVYNGYYGLTLDSSDWTKCTTEEGVIVNSEEATGGSWYEMSLSSSSINTTGLSQYKLQSTDETNSGRSEWHSADGTNKPELTVYYEQAEEEEPGSGEGEAEPPYGQQAAEQVEEVIETVKEAVKIPAWGFWLIIGSLGTVAVASILAKTGGTAKPRGVKPRKSTYTPHKRRSPQRRLPKRDRQGRFK